MENGGALRSPASAAGPVSSKEISGRCTCGTPAVNNYNLHRDEWREPPVPAGLNNLTDSQPALAELYGLEAIVGGGGGDRAVPPRRFVFSALVKLCRNGLKKQPERN